MTTCPISYVKAKALRLSGKPEFEAKRQLRDINQPCLHVVERAEGTKKGRETTVCLRSVQTSTE